jgi:hypothetical protein
LLGTNTPAYLIGVSVRQVDKDFHQVDLEEDEDDGEAAGGDENRHHPEVDQFKTFFVGKIS